MARQVTIPIPEGLQGDYSSPCDNQGTACPPDRQGDLAADARAAWHCPDAARAFRESLARLPPLASSDPGAAECLHTVEFNRIAA